MKKILVLACAVMIAAVAMAVVRTTKMASYNTLDTIADVSGSPDTDLAAATGFFIGAVSGEIDLLRGRAGRSASETYANNIALILHVTGAANGDTVTQVLYGRVDGGPPQPIASIAWKVGLAQVNATATHLWAETATVTPYHPSTITPSGSDGDDMVGQVILDVTGYRYIKSYFTAQTGQPSTATCLYRYL